MHKVTVRCRSLAQSILAIFPDLRDSIVDRDIALSQSIFDRLRSWISEVKVEAQRMQTTYAGLIMEVQMSVESARALLPLPLHTHHHHAAHTHGAALAQPPLSGGHSAPAVQADARMLLAASERPMASEPPALAARPPDTTPTSPPLPSRSSDSGNSPLLLTRPSPSPLPHAGDELMEMLFDTPSVVGDDRRLQRILTRLGVSSEAGHVVATRSSPAAAVIAAMQQVAGTGANGSGPSGFASVGGAAGAFVPSAPVVGHAVPQSREPAVPTRDTVPALAPAFPATAPPAAAAAPQLHLPWAAYGHGPVAGAPAQSISPKTAKAPPEQSGADSMSRGGDAGSLVTLTSTLGDGGKCLGCALADLRRVDVILTSSVDFWTSMELVIDVAVRRKEHSETLLLHASSRRALAKATSSLQDYMAFWQAFHFLCGRYAEALQIADLYGWLSSPEAEEEHSHHHRGNALQQQQQLLATDSAVFDPSAAPRSSQELPSLFHSVTAPLSLKAAPQEWAADMRRL